MDKLTPNVINALNEIHLEATLVVTKELNKSLNECQKLKENTPYYKQASAEVIRYNYILKALAELKANREGAK